MAIDPANTVVPALQRLYLAQDGTTAPDGPTIAMPAGWHDVGAFTEDSLKFNASVTVEAIKAAQTRWAIRRYETAQDATFEVDLLEWSGDNFIAVYGGGTITTVTPSGGGPDYYKFSPPAVGGRQTIAACIEIIDGTKHYRRIVPMCMQTEGVELGLSAISPGTLPLRMSVIGSDSADPWYDITDDPAFAP